MVDCGVDGKTVAVGHHWYPGDDASMLEPDTWQVHLPFTSDCMFGRSFEPP